MLTAVLLTAVLPISASHLEPQTKDTGQCHVAVMLALTVDRYDADSHVLTFRLHFFTVE